ncbi:Cell cycle checkpoint control protein rad9b [Podila verticillata]|nr:Cell cycle checkpoint control protein rad9b [Podila verticillata]
MKALIPSVSISAFRAVLTCLAKIGDDVTIEARLDSISFSTINITRSAFANFTFARSFFETYHIDVNAESVMHDAGGPYMRCKVLSKALVSACKIRGNVEQKLEKCCIVMESAEGVGENCRLTIELIFKHGFIKIHKLLYESCLDNLRVIYSKETFPSSWRMTANALMGLMDNFSSKSEEVSMECNQDGMVLSTCKSTQDVEGAGTKRIGTTRVQINKTAIENYRLQDNIEITFTLKEFKAITRFACDLRLSLEGFFDSRNRPMLLSVESENIISASFALATIVGENEVRDYDPPQRVPGTDMRGNGYSQGPSQSQVGQGHGQGHEYKGFSQPENALDFGDDDDWEKELGDFDMEEAMSSSVGTQATVLVGNNDPTQAQAATNPDQSSIQQEPQEIEERDFLPTGQPGPKRRRYVFDEDEDDDDE